jgi:hypothetical protein
LAREARRRFSCAFGQWGLPELCWRLFTWRGEIEILGPVRLKTLMADQLARFAGASAPV